jgi:poly(3-hydroxybutyrate) depolymerase
MAKVARAMKITTVRFGEDLWALLETEAARAGVSVSQYIREAALARAAAAAAARGDEPFELLARAGMPDGNGRPDAGEDRTQSGHRRARSARRQAAETREESDAVRAESEQAIRHSGELASRYERFPRS